MQAEKDLVKERAKLNRFELEEKGKVKSKINSIRMVTYNQAGKRCTKTAENKTSRAIRHRLA